MQPTVVSLLADNKFIRAVYLLAETFLGPVQLGVGNVENTLQQACDDLETNASSSRGSSNENPPSLRKNRRGGAKASAEMVIFLLIYI